MRKWFLIIFLFCIFLFLPKNIQAAYFKLEPSSINKNANETFTVDVYVDSGSEEIRGVDIYVTFDSNLVSGQSVSAGDFFSSVTNNIESNRVIIHGMMDDASTKTGLGKVASITFKALSAGSGTIGFDCNESVIAKADINATNILECSSNVSASLTVSGGGGTSNNNGGTSNNNGGTSNNNGGSNNSESSGDSNLSNSTPTSLPRTGIIEKMKTWAILSLILLAIGGTLKFIINI